MSTMKQVMEDIGIADRSRPGMLTAEELELIDRVREAYHSLKSIPCSNCKYCMPCPSGVEISKIFQIYNDCMMYDDLKVARFMYAGPFSPKPEQRADQCIECGECLEKCPQNVPIPDWLKKVHEVIKPDE